MATMDGSMLEHGARLPTRLALGSTMLFHGSQKLKPEGISQLVPFFEQIGFRPAKPWIIATGVTEALAGALALAGIGTRVAALGILVTQGVAIAKVHARKGFANEKHGFEFNLALCAMALGLLLTGPGRMSAHRFARRKAKRFELMHGRILPRNRKLSRALELLA